MDTENWMAKTQQFSDSIIQHQTNMHMPLKQKHTSGKVILIKMFDRIKYYFFNERLWTMNRLAHYVGFVDIRLILGIVLGPF